MILRAASRLTRRHLVALDYPPTAESRPRWGHGRAPQPRLAAALERHRDAYRESLETIVACRSDLVTIPRFEHEPGEPFWRSTWLPALDGAALYAFTRTWRPANYLEVGSGVSTSFVAKAKRDGALSTKIISIDPQPRAEIDRLCDEVIRSPLEQTDLTLFASLEAGDIVFIDNSHRVFMNSDATTFMFDVLPELPSGVLVGVHDIFWPDDYPPEWSEFHFSEQYVLGVYVISEVPWLVPVFPAWHVAHDAELAGLVRPLWDDPRLDDIDTRGWSFWFRIER